MTSIIFDFLALLDEMSLILLLILIVFYLVLSLSLYKIFKQNNINSTNALIPVYNVISLLELVSLPKFLIVLVFVPYVNILGIMLANMIIGWRLGKAFQCNIVLTICIMFLPIVGYPLLALKKLEYHQLQPSPLLFNKKVVEEKKDEELVIPKYDIDISNLKDVSALTINNFLADNKSVNTPSIRSKSNMSDADDLTFDYNDIYINEINNEEEKSRMNYDFQNNQSFEPITDNNSVVITPAEPVIQEPVMDIPMAPVEPVIPEPVQDIPIASVEPVVPEPVMDIPIAPVEPVVPEPVQDISIAPVEPVVPEPVQDIPIAQVEPVMPEPVQDIPMAPVEPVVPEPVQDIPIAQVEPVIPEPVQDIPIAPVEPVIPEPVIGSSADSTVIESVIPEKKEEIPQLSSSKPKPYSADGYTFDYNSLYNIAPATEQPVPLKEAPKEKMVKEVDPLESLNMAAPPSFEVPVKAEEKVEELQKPIVPKINKSDLVSIEIKEPDVLPVGTLGRKKPDGNGEEIHKNGVVFAHPPTNNNVNMVSATRNGNINSQVNPMMANNNMNNNSRPMINGGNSIQGNNVYRNSNNVNGNLNGGIYGGNIPNNNQRGVNGPHNNTSYNMPPANNSMNYNMPNNQNRNIGPNNFNNPNYGNNGMYHSGNPNSMNSAPQGSLLRPNEDSRSYMNMNQPRANAKFITNDDTKYTLPKSEPLPVQMPTDPNLIANPMAIFGSGSTSLRPTSGEAMQQNYSQSAMQGMPNQNNNVQGVQRPINNTCPNCGFVIKPGQPSCVVCGYRLM